MYASKTVNGLTSYRAIGSASDARDDETVSDDAPSQTLADIAAGLEVTVQAWLDGVVQGNGYPSCDRCVNYMSSSVSQWASDAKAASDWRDAVWTKFYADQESWMTSPPDPIPTASQYIATLPQPADYGWVVHDPGES